MSLQERLDAAVALINEHNTAIGSKDLPGYIDVEGFPLNIKASGGTTEDRLKSMSYEDILDCMIPTASGPAYKPKPLAKDIAQVFRGKADDVEVSIGDAGSQTVFVGPRKAERMSLRELLECYDPHESDNAVGTRLAKITKGEPCIVFKDDGQVDIVNSLTLCNEIKLGYSGRQDFAVNGDVKRVYRIGESLPKTADENPVYHNRPLRPDGTCDQTGRSWAGVPQDVRQLVYIAVETGEVKANVDNAHNVLDLAMTAASETGAIGKLRSRWRKAALRFDEARSVGDLPTLKLPLVSPDGDGGKEVAGRKAGPFDKGRKVNITTFNSGNHQGVNFTTGSFNGAKLVGCCWVDVDGKVVGIDQEQYVKNWLPNAPFTMNRRQK